MYFDGTTLTALLTDAEKAAAINTDGGATSPLAVIEAAIELPELGEEELSAFRYERHRTARHASRSSFSRRSYRRKAI